MFVCVVDTALATCRRGFQRALHFTLKLIAACQHRSCQTRSFSPCTFPSPPLAPTVRATYVSLTAPALVIHSPLVIHIHTSSSSSAPRSIQLVGLEERNLLVKPRGSPIMSTLLFWRSLRRTERDSSTSRDETKNKYSGRLAHYKLILLLAHESEGCSVY